MKRCQTNDYVLSAESAYLEATSQIVACTNKTDAFILGRVKKLILAQHSFEYGLIYFALLLLLAVFLATPQSLTRANEISERLHKLEETINSQIIPTEQGMVTDIDRLSKASLDQSNRLTAVSLDLSTQQSEVQRLRQEQLVVLADIRQLLQELADLQRKP